MAQCSQFSNFWKNFFQKKYPKIQNVNFGGENQSCSHRNSAHFGTQTVPWGPLFDHFPGFNNFDKIGVPGSIPHVCFFLGFSGAAQSFFRGKNRPFPKLNKGTLDFCHFLMNFVDFFVILGTLDFYCFLIIFHVFFVILDVVCKFSRWREGVMGRIFGPNLDLF